MMTRRGHKSNARLEKHFSHQHCLSIKIMTLLAIARSRAASLRPVVRKVGAIRSASGYSGPEVDYEHFSAGWDHIADIKDFTDSGKYTTQTFNKISPQVIMLRYCLFWFCSSKLVRSDKIVFLFYL